MNELSLYDRLDELLNRLLEEARKTTDVLDLCSLALQIASVAETMRDIAAMGQRMAQLIFYDNVHTYEVDGAKMDSVSEVLRFLSREEYQSIDQYRLDNAAERGTAVHKACEMLYVCKSVECTPDIEPYVMAFAKFLKEHDCNFTDIERPLADVDMGIAGTPDLCGTVDGDEAIVDLKAQAAIHKVLVKAQLNAYRNLRIKNSKPEANKLYCLQLMNDGNYRLYPAKIDDTEFMSCYALHTALKKKHPRGAID